MLFMLLIFVIILILTLFIIFICIRLTFTFNYICSNVRGPRAGSLDGAPMVDLASVGPLVHGLGLNFTGWSFGDRLTVSVVLCPDHVPDVWDIVDRIPPALEELVEATRAAT